MGRIDRPEHFLVWGPPCGRGSPTLGLILLLNPKIHVVARNGLDLIFCYILVKALMGNFRFQGRPGLFWRGHRCKKNSEISAFRWVTPLRIDPTTQKLKISYILVKTLMGNFRYRACRTNFWRGHRCKKNSENFRVTPMTPSKNGSTAS